jgi:hypothetical protein
MYVTRCQDQKSKTLDEFYADIADYPPDRECGTAMLNLIARLRELPDERRIYGLTSHYRLCLLAEDTYRSSCFVIVIALDKRNYFIEYLMPESAVRGEARSENEALQMILLAMEKSGGWPAIPTPGS